MMMMMTSKAALLLCMTALCGCVGPFNPLWILVPVATPPMALAVEGTLSRIDPSAFVEAFTLKDTFDDSVPRRIAVCPSYRRKQYCAYEVPVHSASGQTVRSRFAWRCVCGPSQVQWVATEWAAVHGVRPVGDARVTHYLQQQQ